MNRQEIAEVRRTWELASARMPLFSELFCTRMQSVANRHGTLFGKDAATSARLLLRLVGIAVNGLNQPRILLPLLKTLGRENARQLIKARQNRLVIHALLWSLRVTLGASYNSHVRHAWIACYRVVTQAMQSGMAETLGGRRWKPCPATPLPLLPTKPPYLQHTLSAC